MMKDTPHIADITRGERTDINTQINHHMQGLIKTDEELIYNFKSGDDQALEKLMERYKGQIKKWSQKLFVPGGDNDDLIQEGMIGLLKSIYDYQQGGGASFKTFANLCVNRHLSSFIKSSQRQKHTPLNSYLSIHEKSEEGGYENLPTTYDEQKNPEEFYLGKELQQSFALALKNNLSDLEKEVLIMHLSDFSYKEIAQKLNKSDKTIDNTLHRIKTKAKTVLKNQ